MLGIIGLAIVITTGVIWWRRIQSVTVPRNRTPFFAGFLGGATIGLIGAFQGGWVSMLTGGVAALVGFSFSALRLQSAQKPNAPTVGLGEKMLAFSAPDAEGVDFDLSTVSGRPYLLKFFRGHW